jgi:hypothetical protein
VQRYRYKSSGCSPVRLAIRASMRGPISSASWKAKTTSSHPKDASRSHTGPGTHAAAKEMLNRSGPASAWSRRSAMTRSASA